MQWGIWDKLKLKNILTLNENDGDNNQIITEISKCGLFIYLYPTVCTRTRGLESTEIDFKGKCDTKLQYDKNIDLITKLT